MDMEIERTIMEAETPPPPEALATEMADNQFDKMLSEAITDIDGLMLVTVTDADRLVLFREALSMFHEPLFEETLVDKCYDAFENIRKMQLGSNNVMTLIYGAMQIVQFRVGPFYGTVVCDAVSNMGLVHNLVNRIRSCLQILSEMSSNSQSE
ncbi:hypothetical protein LPJ56_002286 [Coemansia sp. RSA 2599]|nr:hypothetical protein LPJ75_001958 [Coemansia sp. RSA 2598]KAJ1826228.1 hypothetical protein LPJ56_002286 [Coemansia sp. RSA 2599]